MKPWTFTLRYSCGVFALLICGTTVRGCIEVTEPVAAHYVTAGGAQ